MRQQLAQKGRRATFGQLAVTLLAASLLAANCDAFIPQHLRIVLESRSEWGILRQSHGMKLIGSRNIRRSLAKPKGVPETNEGNWQDEVLSSTAPVLAFFSAPWCGPCRMVIPVVEEIAQEISSETLKVVSVCTDESPSLAADMKITSIPTLLLIKDGKVLDSFVGAVPKGSLLTMLRNNLGGIPF